MRYWNTSKYFQRNPTTLPQFLLVGALIGIYHDYPCRVTSNQQKGRITRLNFHETNSFASLSSLYPPHLPCRLCQRFLHQGGVLISTWLFQAPLVLVGVQSEKLMLRGNWKGSFEVKSLIFFMVLGNFNAKSGGIHGFHNSWFWCSSKDAVLPGNVNMILWLRWYIFNSLYIWCKWWLN